MNLFLVCLLLLRNSGSETGNEADYVVYILKAGLEELFQDLAGSLDG